MTQQATLPVRQQFITPVKCCTERLMSRERRSAPAAEKREAIIQSQCNLLRTQRGGARRCKLDGKRNAIEVPADRRDRWKTLFICQEVRAQCRCPGDEQLHGAMLKDSARLLLTLQRHVQRGNAIDMLALDPQHLSAGRKNGSGRT